MRTDVNKDPRTQQALRTAQMTCWCLGMALLLWGLAPALVRRLASGHVPPLETFALGGAPMFVGVGFLVLCVLVGRGVGWALWAALIGALTLVLGSVIMAVLTGAAPQSAFAVLLSGSAAVTTWLAIDARRTALRSPQNPGAA